MRSSHSKILTMVQVALFCAIVAVLQLFFANIRIGAVTLSFTLVPIVIAGIFIGPWAGMIVGLFSGVLTFIQVFTSGDPFYVFLMTSHPIVTAFLCMIKTSAAGLLSGLAYKFFKNLTKHRTVSTLISAIVCPVVNTGIFCLTMLLIYSKDFLNDATFGPAASAGLITFVFIGLAGINFIFEVLLNIVLCPVIGRALFSTSLFDRTDND